MAAHAILDHVAAVASLEKTKLVRFQQTHFASHA